MNRRIFLRSLFASTATIVVAPEVALEALDALVSSTRTYVDMGIRPPFRALLNEGEFAIVLPEDGVITIVSGEPVTIAWGRAPMIFTDEERLRTYAAGGWRLVRTNLDDQKRIKHADPASEPT